MTNPAPLLQDRLKCRAAEAIPGSTGESGASPGQPNQVPEQSLKTEVPTHTLCLLQRALKADTTYSCSPGGKLVATHRYGQVLRQAEPRPRPLLIPPGLAPHSAVSSGGLSSSPRSPKSQGRRYKRRKETSFSTKAAKHQLNPKQCKLRPWELTYIVLHVLFWGSELLVIRAATRWVNQPKTETKCQQSDPVPGQGLLNLPLSSTGTSAVAHLNPMSLSPLGETSSGYFCPKGLFRRSKKAAGLGAAEASCSAGEGAGSGQCEGDRRVSSA